MNGNTSSSIEKIKSCITCYDGRYLEVANVRFRFTLAEDEDMLMLHIFLDRSVMEVFVNDGRTCATRIIYPPEDAQGIEVFAQEC